MLRVQLLGSGRIFDNDAEIKLRSRVWTLPLLGYLLVHRGEVIPRRRLAFTIWPDEAEDDALERLRHNLYRLMKALPSADDDAPWLSAAGHTIGWNAAAKCACDVTEFERLRADEATLESAVAAYSGDLLAEFDADWIAVERERLRRFYHDDLQALIRTKRSRRALESAAHYAQLLLASDPWNEECLRALISVRYEGGDAAGALAHYDAFARRLRAEMNADPMPETRALREAIARGVAIPSMLGAAQTTPTRRALPTPFVGRTVELGKLRDWWLRAARGTGGLVVVRGEAGIGKSRIVSELALGVEGVRVLVGTTSSPERQPYECLAVALREALPLVAGVALAPPFLAALAELVPELRSHRADIPQLARLDPASERARLLDALAQALAALARPRPLLVILEDLHRAGPATIEAISSIVPRVAQSRMLIVATCRPENVDRIHPLRPLINDPALTLELLELGPLAERDIRSLVDALAGEQQSSAEFLAQLVVRSAGNPLFVTELLRHGRDAGDGVASLPDSVRALISERLASIAAPSRAVVEIAAIAGEAFTVEMVHDVARFSYGEVLDALDELLDRHLVRESTGYARYEYAFTHHLVHAAIYDGVPADARLRRHRRIARILDTTCSDAAAGAERAGEIAHHYERGGDAPRAAHHYAIAAWRAAALYANEEARDLVDRSLKLDPRDDRRRFELLLLRSRLNARLGDASADHADTHVLEELAERLDPDAKGEALLRRIDLAVRRADREGECDAIERLRSHANATGSDRWLAATDEAQAQLHFRDQEIFPAIERAIGSRERYERLGDNAACARVTALAARAAIFDFAQAENAEQLASEALRLAEAVGDPETRISALCDAARVATGISMDDRRAAELAQAALAISIEIGDRAAEVRCRESLGVICIHSLQIEAAAMQLREALRLCETLGLTERLPYVLNNLAFALCETDIKATLNLVQRAADEHRKRGAVKYATIFNNIAGAAWELGDLLTMSAALEECLPIVESQAEYGYPKSIFFQLKARLLRCQRRFDDSIVELEKLLATLEKERPCMSFVILKNIAEAYEDLAVTQFCSGRLSAARQSLDRSVEVSQQSGKEPQNLMRRHWIDACLCRAEGRPDEARLALGRATEIYRAQLVRLTDPGLRASFAEMPVNRAIRVALERDEWPAPDSPCIIAFPGPASSPGSPLLKPDRVGVGASAQA